MKTVRMFFSKTARAAYISHLDLSRTMQRALKRAKLPVWYTEGFNPHIYLTFALPLSLGHEGLCESMDFRLTEDVEYDELVARINECLPAGLAASGAAEAKMNPGEITFASYEIEMDMSGFEDPMKLLEDYLNKESIEVERKSKKGIITVDIKPDLNILGKALDGNNITVVLILPAGSQKNVNPNLFVTGFEASLGAALPKPKFVRTALYDEKMREFE